LNPQHRAGVPLEIGLVFYPSFGGSGIIASDLASGLAHRGHQVHVIASALPSRPLANDEQLVFHQVEAADYPLFGEPPYVIAVGSRIVEICRKQRLDLVHVHYAVPHAASAYLARQVLGEAAPLFVTTLHGTDVTGIGSADAYRTINRFTIAASDAVTVPSEFLSDQARRLLQLAADCTIDVIPNFVDTDHFAPPEHRDRRRLDELFAGDAGGVEGPVLFHVSNLRAVKRPVDLALVLARVRREMPARMVVVGDGPERAVLADCARNLGVENSMRFVGSLPDFAALLRHADAFVLPSASESFGVAALEALSSGVPVCAYRVGGLPEVVVEGAGRLVEPYDVEALAAAVVEVVSDPTRRAHMGEIGRAHAVAHFQRAPAIERYEALYRRLMDRKVR